MTTYLLTYDVAAAADIQTQLLLFVRENRYIVQWSQPFEGCYIFKSSYGFRVLADSFYQFLGARRHLITTITPDDTDGRISTDIWTWLNMSEPSALGALQQARSTTG